MKNHVYRELIESVSVRLRTTLWRDSFVEIGVSIMPGKKLGLQGTASVHSCRKLITVSNCFGMLYIWRNEKKTLVNQWLIRLFFFCNLSPICDDSVADLRR